MTLYNFLLFYLTKKTIYILCIWPHIIFIILLIIGVWTISFSRKKKKRFTKEKVLARLGRLRLQGALALRSFHHEAMLHDEKSPVTSRWLCELPWKKIFRVSYLFNSSKTLGFSEHRKGGYAAALGEPTSEHAVFNI